MTAEPTGFAHTDSGRSRIVSVPSVTRDHLNRVYRRWVRANAAAAAAHEADNRRLSLAINRWHESAKALYVACLACHGITELDSDYVPDEQRLINYYTAAYAAACSGAQA